MASLLLGSLLGLVARSAGRADGIRVEGELLAHAQGRGDPMYLFDVAEPRRNQHRAIGQPVEKRGFARLPVLAQPFGQLSIARRDAFEYEIAALLASRRSLLSVASPVRMIPGQSSASNPFRGDAEATFGHKGARRRVRI